MKQVFWNKPIFQEDIQKRLQVLKQLAVIFSQHHITWALGSSGMLFFHGVVDTFHDLDIMVLSSEFEKIRLILQHQGTVHESPPHPMYQTKHFIEMVLDGVEIDMMADLTVNGVPYPLHAEDIDCFVELEGCNIPLHKIENWLPIYRAIGRLEKVQIIDQYLKK